MLLKCTQIIEKKISNKEWEENPWFACGTRIRFVIGDTYETSPAKKITASGEGFK